MSSIDIHWLQLLIIMEKMLGDIALSHCFRRKELKLLVTKILPPSLNQFRRVKPLTNQQIFYSTQEKKYHWKTITLITCTNLG